jgi:hypothetical protein
MYVLSVDLSSLVIRPPFIRSPSNAIESETGHLRHFFSSNKGNAKMGQSSLLTQFQRSAVTLSEDLPPSPRLWRDKPSRRLLANTFGVAQFAEIASDLKK